MQFFNSYSLFFYTCLGTNSITYTYYVYTFCILSVLCVYVACIFNVCPLYMLTYVVRIWYSLYTLICIVYE